MLFISLIGCSTGIKFEKITDIQLEEITYIYLGWRNLQSVGINVNQKDIENFYNKINCIYELKEYKEQKKEQYTEHASYYILINTNDGKSFVCYYATEKVYFIMDNKKYVSTKKIPSLATYWELEL